MLLSLLNNFGENPRMAIITILMMIPTLLIALTVHEYSHGRMALALGDKTALMSGRLSLNPIHHLDPIGAVMMLLFGFGFAKPVPVNLRNATKVNYKTATILISLAGPLSNFILAFLGVFGLLVTETVSYNTSGATVSAILSYNLPISSTIVIVCYYFFLYFSLMNIGLGDFNLIPIPPLDGSRILTVFLPARLQILFHRYENIIQLVLFALLFTNILDRFLYGIRSIIFNGMMDLISQLPFII